MPSEPGKDMEPNSLAAILIFKMNSVFSRTGSQARRAELYEERDTPKVHIKLLFLALPSMLTRMSTSRTSNFGV